jgi:hypothetical protein
MLSYVKAAQADVVCISALPPFAFNHARLLYTRMRTILPAQHIVICLWDYQGDHAKAAIRLRIAGGHAFFTKLRETVQHIKFQTGQVPSDSASIPPS